MERKDGVGVLVKTKMVCCVLELGLFQRGKYNSSAHVIVLVQTGGPAHSVCVCGRSSLEGERGRGGDFN